MFELIFLMILQLSIFSLQTVPKSYSSNFQEQKDFDRKSRKASNIEKTLFCYTANPSKCQICKGSRYEIKLTLLCETITYFRSTHSASENFLKNFGSAHICKCYISIACFGKNTSVTCLYNRDGARCQKLGVHDSIKFKWREHLR